MRAVVQRVLEASVTVMEGADKNEKREVGRIGPGLLALVGVRTDDTIEDARELADKIARLRVLEDANGKLNLSLLDTGQAALVVSNFTLYGDCRNGRRPGFTEAAGGELAQQRYRDFLDQLTLLGVPTETGQFGAEMQVALINDGPITLLLDSRKQF